MTRGTLNDPRTDTVYFIELLAFIPLLLLLLLLLLILLLLLLRLLLSPPPLSRAQLERNVVFYSN